MTKTPTNQAEPRVDGSAEGEVDRIIEERFFAGREHGVFVDVGAARPDYLSVSARFRARGWEVLAIEPNPAYRPHYERRGIEMLEYACGQRDEDNVAFSVVDSHGTAYGAGAVTFESWSSLGIKDNYAALKKDLDVSKINVKVRRLDTIMKLHAPHVAHIDVVSLDVEGWELEALSGLDFDRYTPSVLVVENLFGDAGYRAFMKQRNYVLWSVIYPNDVYVRSTLLGPVETLVASLKVALSAACDRVRQIRRTFTRSSPTSPSQENK